MPCSSPIPVSVVIPAHNAEGWLSRSVASALGDGVDEIVIVDDGSTDNTARIARDLATRNRCITFRADRQSTGAAAARLRAATLARNEWIAPLDSDDYLGEHAVSMAFKQAQTDRADICLWTMYRVKDGVPTAWPDMSALTFPISGRHAARLTLGSWRIHASGVIRKDNFLKAAAAVEIESFNSDELITRCLFLISERVTACSAGYYYVDNPVSTTRTKTVDFAALARSQTWLLRFARDSGFLAGDPTLAQSMVRAGLDIADELSRTRPQDDLLPLLELLSECNPPLWKIGRGDQIAALRGRGSRRRIRVLRHRPRVPD